MNGRRRPRETCEVEVLCSGTVYRLISRACVAGTPSGGCAGTPERVLPHAPEHGLQPVRRRACAPEHVGGARALGLRGRAGCDARVFLSVPSTCKHLLELTKHLKEGLQTLVEMTKHLQCNDETLVETTKHLPCNNETLSETTKHLQAACIRIP